MRAVTATAFVHPDHTLTVPVPEDIAPGLHVVVVVLQDGAALPPRQFFLANVPAHNVEMVDPTMTFRREDIYGDDGR